MKKILYAIIFLFVASVAYANVETNALNWNGLVLFNASESLSILYKNWSTSGLSEVNGSIFTIGTEMRFVRSDYSRVADVGVLCFTSTGGATRIYAINLTTQTVIANTTCSAININNNYACDVMFLNNSAEAIIISDHGQINPTGGHMTLTKWNGSSFSANISLPVGNPPNGDGQTYGHTIVRKPDTNDTFAIGNVLTTTNRSIQFYIINMSSSVNGSILYNWTSQLFNNPLESISLTWNSNGSDLILFSGWRQNTTQNNYTTYTLRYNFELNTTLSEANVSDNLANSTSREIIHSAPLGNYSDKVMLIIQDSSSRIAADIINLSGSVIMNDTDGTTQRTTPAVRDSIALWNDIANDASYFIFPETSGLTMFKVILSNMTFNTTAENANTTNWSSGAINTFHIYPTPDDKGFMTCGIDTLLDLMCGAYFNGSHIDISKAYMVNNNTGVAAREPYAFFFTSINQTASVAINFPDAVTSLSSPSQSNSSINISWIKGADQVDGGYLIYYGSTLFENITNYLQNSSNITGLTANTQYNLTVISYNSTGINWTNSTSNNILVSTQANTDLAIDLPDQPWNLSLYLCGTTWCNVTYLVASDQVNGWITFYAGTTMKVNITDLNQRSANLTGLTQGTVNNITAVAGNNTGMNWTHNTTQNNILATTLSSATDSREQCEIDRSCCADINGTIGVLCWRNDTNTSFNQLFKWQDLTKNGDGASLIHYQGSWWHASNSNYMNQLKGGIQTFEMAEQDFLFSGPNFDDYGGSVYNKIWTPTKIMQYYESGVSFPWKAEIEVLMDKYFVVSNMAVFCNVVGGCAYPKSLNFSYNIANNETVNDWIYRTDIDGSYCGFEQNITDSNMDGASEKILFANRTIIYVMNPCPERNFTINRTWAYDMDENEKMNITTVIAYKENESVISDWIENYYLKEKQLRQEYENYSQAYKYPSHLNSSDTHNYYTGVYGIWFLSFSDDLYSSISNYHGRQVVTPNFVAYFGMWIWDSFWTAHGILSSVNMTSPHKDLALDKVRDWIWVWDNYTQPYVGTRTLWDRAIKLNGTEALGGQPQGGWSSAIWNLYKLDGNATFMCNVYDNLKDNFNAWKDVDADKDYMIGTGMALPSGVMGRDGQDTFSSGELTDASGWFAFDALNLANIATVCNTTDVVPFYENYTRAKTSYNVFWNESLQNYANLDTNNNTYFTGGYQNSSGTNPSIAFAPLLNMSSDDQSYRVFRNLTTDFVDIVGLTSISKQHVSYEHDGAGSGDTWNGAPWVGPDNTLSEWALRELIRRGNSSYNINLSYITNLTLKVMYQAPFLAESYDADGSGVGTWGSQPYGWGSTAVFNAVWDYNPISTLSFDPANSGTTQAQYVFNASFLMETFDQPNRFSKIYNINFSDNISRINHYTNLSEQIGNYTNNSFTTFFLDFEYGNLSAKIGLGGTAPTNDNANYTLSTDCLFAGYCLKLYNESNGNKTGILRYALGNTLPVGSQNFTVEFYYRIDNESTLNKSCGIGTSFVYLHNKVNFAQGCGIVANYDASGNRMETREDDTQVGEWHHIKFVQTIEKGINETYLFMDGQFVDYQFNKSASGNDFGFGMSFGGAYNSNAVTHSMLVTLDSIRIQNRSDFSNVNASMRNENYSMWNNYLESLSYDTSQINPNITIKWTENLPSNGSDVVLMLSFSDDNITWTNYFWNNPTVVFSQDNGDSSTVTELMPMFGNYSWNFSVAFNQLSSSTCGEPSSNISSALFAILNASQHDIGAESDTTLSDIQSDYNAAVICNPQYGNARVIRPYFNSYTKNSIKMWRQTGFKYAHTSAEGDYYFDWLGGGSQCDTSSTISSSCINNSVDEAISERKLKVITIHDVKNPWALSASLKYVNDSNVTVMSYKQARDYYFPTNPNGSFISSEHTKRYFKYSVLLISGDGIATPTIDNLNFSWTVSLTPLQVINLNSPSKTSSSIFVNWSYTDTNSSGAVLYLNGSNIVNVSYPTNNYNFTGLTQDTQYPIIAKSYNGGNINTTESFQNSITETTSASSLSVAFVSPTLPNLYVLSNTTTIVNVSIESSNMKQLYYNWNGTNYTMFDQDKTLLFFNFDNNSAIGDNITHIIDSSNNHFNATIFGDASYNNSGRYDAAMSFDGTGDYLLVHDNAILENMSKLSIELWVYPRACAQYDEFVKKDLSFIVRMQSDCSIQTITWADVDVKSVVSSSKLALNSWNHIVMVYNGSHQYILINGSRDASTPGTQTGNIDISSYGVYIGASQAGYTEDYNGLIDNLIVSNESYSDATYNQRYMANLERVLPTQWYLEVNQTKNKTTQLSEGTYTYQTSVFDASSVVNTDLRTLYIVTTPVPPIVLQVENISVVSNTTNSIEIDFDYNSAPTGAYLYRNGTLITTLYYANNSYNFTGLTKSTLYNFTVFAFGANGTNTSVIDNENTILLYTKSDNPPLQIENLTVASNYTNWIYVSMNYSDSTTEKALLRLNGNNIANLTYPDIDYNFTSLTAGTTYNITIFSFNSSGTNETYSPENSITHTTSNIPQTTAVSSANLVLNLTFDDQNDPWKDYSAINHGFNVVGTLNWVNSSYCKYYGCINLTQSGTKYLNTSVNFTIDNTIAWCSWVYHNTVPGTSRPGYFQMSSWLTRNFKEWFEDNQGFTFKMNNQTNNEVGHILGYTNPTGANAWHFICFQKNDTNITLWRDSAVVASTLSNNTFGSNLTDIFTIGDARYANTADMFMDEILMWNDSVLTNAIVTQMWNEKRLGTPPDMDAYISEVNYDMLDHRNWTHVNRSLFTNTIMPINITIKNAGGLNSTGRFNWTVILDQVELCAGNLNLSHGEQQMVQCNWTTSIGFHQGYIYLNITDYELDNNNLSLYIPYLDHPYWIFNRSEWDSIINKIGQDPVTSYNYQWTRGWGTNNFSLSNNCNSADTRANDARNGATVCFLNNYTNVSAPNDCNYALSNLLGWAAIDPATCTNVQSDHYYGQVIPALDLMYNNLTRSQVETIIAGLANKCQAFSNLPNVAIQNDDPTAINGGNGFGFGAGMGTVCYGIMGEYSRNPLTIQNITSRYWGGSMYDMWMNREISFLKAHKNDSDSEYQEGMGYKFYSEYHLVDNLLYAKRYNVRNYSSLYNNAFCAMGKELYRNTLDFNYNGLSLRNDANQKYRTMTRGDAYSYQFPQANGNVDIYSYYGLLCNDTQVKKDLVYTRELYLNKSGGANSNYGKLQEIFLWLLLKNQTGTVTLPPITRSVYDNANDIFTMRTNYTYVNDTVFQVDGGEEKGGGHSQAQGFFLYALGEPFVDYNQVPLNDDVRKEVWMAALSFSNSTSAGWTSSCGAHLDYQFIGSLNCQQLGSYPDYRNQPFNQTGDLEDYFGTTDAYIGGVYDWKPMYNTVQPTRAYFIKFGDLLVRRVKVDNSPTGTVLDNSINILDEFQETMSGNNISFYRYGTSANMDIDLLYSNSSATLYSYDSGFNYSFTKTGTARGKGHYRRTYLLFNTPSIDFIRSYHWYYNGSERPVTLIDGTDEVVVQDNNTIVFDTNDDNRIAYSNYVSNGWGLVFQNSSIVGGFNTSSINQTGNVLFKANDTVSLVMYLSTDNIRVETNTMKLKNYIDYPVDVNFSVDTAVLTNNSNFTVKKNGVTTLTSTTSGSIVSFTANSVQGTDYYTITAGNELGGVPNQVENITNLTNSFTSTYIVINYTSQVNGGVSFYVNGTFFNNIYYPNITLNVTGLQSFRNYNITAFSFNNSGTNQTVSQENSLSVTTLRETQSPIISGLITDPTNQSVNINFSTDESSNSSINLGTTINLGNKYNVSSYSIAHNYTISNLLNNTLYYYNVTVCDVLDNCNTSGVYNFSTIVTGLYPNQIYNLSGVYGDTWIYLTFNYNDTTTEKGIIYLNGVNTNNVSYPTQFYNLTGLARSTNYNIELLSYNSSGYNQNINSENIISITTSGESNPPLQILNLQIYSISYNGANLSWYYEDTTTSGVMIHKDGLNFVNVSYPIDVYIATGLSPSTTYNFTLYSYNSTGTNTTILSQNSVRVTTESSPSSGGGGGGGSSPSNVKFSVSPNKINDTLFVGDKVSYVLNIYNNDTTLLKFNVNSTMLLSKTIFSLQSGTKTTTKITYNAKNLGLQKYNIRVQATKNTQMSYIDVPVEFNILDKSKIGGYCKVNNNCLQGSCVKNVCSQTRYSSLTNNKLTQLLNSYSSDVLNKFDIFQDEKSQIYALVIFVLLIIVGVYLLFTAIGFLLRFIISTTVIVVILMFIFTLLIYLKVLG